MAWALKEIFWGLNLGSTYDIKSITSPTNSSIHLKTKILLATKYS